jgi:DNA-directed RNA polymerase subunit RPC12/RpoP
MVSLHSGAQNAAMDQFNGERNSSVGMRRLVRLQRSYRCASCAAEHNSWARLSSCPDCGHSLSMAVIRRAALTPV